MYLKILLLVSFIAAQIQACSYPPGLSNGSRTYYSRSEGSFAYYNCNTGYFGSGKRFLQCTGWSWGILRYKCIIRDCGTPPSVPNAGRSYSSTTYGSMVTFTCNTGYTASGSNYIECPSSGSWPSPSYSCTIKDCGTPPSVANAGQSYSSTTYETRVTYSCNTGYTASGSNYIDCPSRGSWPTPSFSCTIKDCGTPPSVANAGRSYSSTTYETRVTYSCNTGYTASGSNYIDCPSSGSWQTPSYSCTIKDCGMPPNISYAVALFNETTYGSYVNYSCVYSFDNTKADYAICDATGNWNLPALNCSDHPEVLKQEQSMLLVTTLPTACVAAIALFVVVLILRKRRLGKQPTMDANEMDIVRLSAIPTEASDNEYEDILPLKATGKHGQSSTMMTAHKVPKNNTKKKTDTGKSADTRDTEIRYQKARGKIRTNTSLASKDQDTGVTGTGNAYQNLLFKSRRITNQGIMEQDIYENMSLPTDSSNQTSVEICYHEDVSIEGVQNQISEQDGDTYVNLALR